jgi:hypothetical protein
MNDIFVNSKNILVVWIDDTDSENLPTFQKILQPKANQAQIAFENVDMLLECKFDLYIYQKKTKFFLSKKKARRASSSFDVILFGLGSKKDSSTNIDLLNEFFRLLRSNGYLIAHIQHMQQTQAVDHFKMCGFNNCNPLDSNSSFLIENKDDDVKRHGSLWLCQKPSFDIGYSVPLRRTGVSLMRQISTTGGGKKTWTVEDDDDDDDDLIDTDNLLDENDRKKPDVKSKLYVQIGKIYIDGVSIISVLAQ